MQTATCRAAVRIPAALTGQDPARPMSRFLVTERQVAQRPAEEEAVFDSERRLAEHLGAWALAGT
jgi:hypothetical protein